MNKIDLIIPVYKAHNKITTALYSIAMQTKKNDIDITLVNDCCPEGDYSDIIKQFENILNIKEIQTEKNVGPGEARNIGIRNTSNEFIAFMDADDCFCQPKSIELLYNIITSDEKIVIARGGFLEEFPDNCCMGVGDMMNDSHVFGRVYRRKVLEEKNIWFPPYRTNEDVGFNMAIEIECFGLEKSIAGTDTPVYCWVYNPESIIRNNHHQFLMDQCICGMVDSVIYTMQNHKVKKEYLDEFLSYRILDLYSIYKPILESENEPFISQALFYCTKFYNLIIKKKIKFFKKFAKETAEMARQEGLIEDENEIIEFLNVIKKEKYKENDIKIIRENIPDGYIINNILCGSAAEEDYN